VTLPPDDARPSSEDRFVSSALGQARKEKTTARVSGRMGDPQNPRWKTSNIDENRTWIVNL